ncbi:uncharacterized protein DS421_6g180650 [Arachis hypogaea]|nr:uncharacterized protein DS421_6g180650 [Arachis hypogaea]
MQSHCRAIASSLPNPYLSSSFSQPRSPQPSPPSQPTPSNRPQPPPATTVAHPLSLLFLSSFSISPCRVRCPTPLFAPASSGEQHPGATQQRLSSVPLRHYHYPHSSFSPSSTQVVEVTELKIDETQRDHIVELDLVYHSLNSSTLGVVAVKYK